MAVFDKFKHFCFSNLKFNSAQTPWQLYGKHLYDAMPESERPAAYIDWLNSTVKPRWDSMSAEKQDPYVQENRRLAKTLQESAAGKF
jgi:hypothetical protein